MSIKPTSNELHDAAERSIGTRDEESRKRARDDMDALRESLRKRLGTMDIVVPSLRELRDE